MQAINFGTSDYGDGLEGRFFWGEERHPIFDQFYQACEVLQGGDRERGKNKMRAILKKDPEFIDAYNEIGADFLEQGNDKKALEYYLKAYKIGQVLIPENFEGQIVWGQLENRPFLRSLHGLGLCYMRAYETDKAIALFETLLKYNPNDNQGIRYLLGDLYLSKKDLKKALVYFEENCHEYPPYRYSYGVYLFLQEQYIKAIIQFWLGFYDNIYIVHCILNNAPLIAYNCWHGTKLEMPDVAKTYYSQNLSLWIGNDHLKQFVDSLYHSYKVVFSIRAFFECKQYLQYIKADSSENINKRKEVLGDIERIRREVTEENAKAVYEEMKKQLH